MDIRLKKFRKNIKNQENLNNDKDIEVSDDNLESADFSGFNKLIENQDLQENSFNDNQNYYEEVQTKKDYSDRNNYLKNLVAAVIILMLAVLTYLGYGKIKEAVRLDNTQTYSNYFANNSIIEENTNILYQKYISSKDSMTNEDIFIDKYSDNEEFNNDAKLNLEKEIKRWDNNLINHYKNLDYTVIQDDKSVLDNNDNFLYENYQKGDFNQITCVYDWYEVIKFDDLGDASVIYTNGERNLHFDNDNALQNLLNRDYEKYYGDYNVQDANRITVKPIKNLIFIYGVKKNLSYSDDISKVTEDQEYSIGYGRGENIIIIIVCIILIAMIISLLVPYKYGVKAIQGKMLFFIPFEINAVIAIIGSSILAAMFYMSMTATINGNAYNYISSNYNIKQQSVYIIIGVFNIIFLFLTYNFIFAGITYIKYIFHTGVIKYYKDNSIFFIFIRGFKNSIKKLVDGIKDINFNSKLDVSILKIVFINFIVLSAISIIRYMGVGIALIYNIALFILIRNYMMDIKSKYKKLLEATNKIAQGDLNININEDLGFFNELKNQLMRIKGGIKKAVSKEVHSERMKTELISNVSHDLKTPLTSIITYTDLLKHGNPTEEEREKYIDTIDKKSKRLKALIEDLFDVSRATSGDIKLNKMDIDIIGLIKQTEIEYEDNLKNANLTVKNNFPSGKIILNVDGEKTYRIFANLLGNAVKYSISGSRVYVDVNNYFDRVEIVMKNISVNEMNFSGSEITERFVRGDKSRNTEGSGLGLAIVKSFTEIQNGKLDIIIDGDLFKAVVIFKR